MRRFNAILLASVLFVNSAFPVAAAQESALDAPLDTSEVLFGASYESSEDASVEASSYSSAVEPTAASEGLSIEEQSDSSSEGYSEEIIIIEDETSKEELSDEELSEEESLEEDEGSLEGSLELPLPEEEEADASASASSSIPLQEEEGI